MTAPAALPKGDARPNLSPRARLEVVRQPSRRRSGALLVAGLLVVFGGLLGLTAFQTRISQGQLHLDRLEGEMRDARMYYDRLRLAIAQLESPEYVVPRAEEMGMAPVDSPTYLTPDVAVVRAAIMAAGPEEGATPGSGEVRGDWREVKRLTGRAP